MTRISKDELMRRTRIILGITVACTFATLFLGFTYIEVMQEGLIQYGPMGNWPNEAKNEGMVWLMSAAAAGLVSVFGVMASFILWSGWWSAGKLEEMKRENEGIHNNSPK